MWKANFDLFVDRFVLNVLFSYMRDVTWLTDEDREIFVALSVMIQGI